MSNRYSMPDENGGRCEGCNRPESVYEMQTTVPVIPGGGWGIGSTCSGTMYLCPSCMKEHQERDARRKYDGCAL